MIFPGNPTVHHRSVKEVKFSEINVISAKITSLIELEEGNMDSERKWTGVVIGGRKYPHINETKFYQIPVIK